MPAEKATGRLRAWLDTPATRGLDADDPKLTMLRREIILSKPFLRKVYREWYELILDALPRSEGRVLELGSGGGFLPKLLPAVLTSEIVAWGGMTLVADARCLPFRPDSLRAIVMTNVFHHFPDPRTFLREASGCIQPGGAIAMVEPWVTPWSRIVYRHLHHEPFNPAASLWEFPSEGPLSGANNALPWIVFRRDRLQFEREFPDWSLERVEPLMPLRYLLAGGLSNGSLMPGFSFRLWRLVEKALSPIMEQVAMFALIVLRKRPISPHRPSS
jgi:SAM-dependent methyltransferase